jgi:triosephosphate isomerase
MNTTRAQGVALVGAIARALPVGAVQVGVAPPFVYIDAVAQALGSSNVWVGAQDCYFESSGAFTGEISADMLKDVGAKFCINGHSERRHVLHESSALTARKAAAIYAAGLTLIHCVGETLEQRDANQTLPVVQSQLSELDPVIVQDPRRLVIAYEPVWAIGTGRTATDQQAQEVHAFIRQEIGKRWNADFADAVRIQYGGSMKPDNAKALMSQPDVDGGLIGGASLKSESFLAIVQAAINN